MIHLISRTIKQSVISSNLLLLASLTSFTSRSFPSNLSINNYLVKQLAFAVHPIQGAVCYPSSLTPWIECIPSYYVVTVDMSFSIPSWESTH